MNKGIIHSILLGLILAIFTPLSLASSDQNSRRQLWQTYAQILDRHLTAGRKHGINLTLVNYQALGNDADFKKLVRDISQFPLTELTNRQQRLAFYINVYNIFALKMVADHWPVTSIKDAGSLFSPVWGKPAGRIDGKTITLKEIEHGILRQMKEPRIHFAIVCASVSCPDLSKEVYQASTLDRQLDNQARLFLGNGGKGLSKHGHDIMVSKIFDWFEDDFGSNDYQRLQFIRHYRPDIPASADIGFLDYDWSVNGN